MLLLPFYGHRPVRMDYNLFLRAVEKLLRNPAEKASASSCSKAEILTFARFLGSRWLVNHFGWTADGLRLRLPSPDFALWTCWTDLMINFSWRRRSQICLRRDGSVFAQLGDKDLRALGKIPSGDSISKAELEEVVAASAAESWKQFRAGNIPAAERALGQEADSEVFVVSPKTGGTAKMRWLLAVLMVLMIAINLPPFKGMVSNSVVGSQHHLARAMRNLRAAKTEEKRFYALGDAAKENFAGGNIPDARKYADELLTLLPKYKTDWNYGNAIQDANLVLGRIAVKEGEIDLAKKFLQQSGDSHGSPQMNSFGPNMSLALDLLKHGERDAVLEYFLRCRKFWKMDHGKLDQWTGDVQKGRTPDFGANLIY